MEYCFTREPIFDRNLNVYGYELNIPKGFNFQLTETEEERSTSRTITGSCLMMDISKLTNGKKAMIPFSKKLLLSQIPTIFPRDSLAVEFLDYKNFNSNTIVALKKLKKANYTITLDSRILPNNARALMQIADIIKIDFSSSHAIEFLDNKITKNLIMWASNLKTQDDYQYALHHKCSLFQGVFYKKPITFISKDIPGYKLNYLETLREISKSDFSYDRLESIIKRDVSLTYKLLKLINSAAYGIPTKISSVKQALVLLGKREIKKWIALISITDMGERKPRELIRLSLLRATLCERIACLMGLKERQSELFLMGLFSLLDVLLARSMSNILAELPISDDIKKSLLGEESGLSGIFQLVLNYEEGNWNGFSLYAKKLNLDHRDIILCFVESIDWVDKLLK